jgi:hypothetical protein
MLIQISCGFMRVEFLRARFPRTGVLLLKRIRLSDAVPAQGRGDNGILVKTWMGGRFFHGRPAPAGHDNQDLTIFQMFLIRGSSARNRACGSGGTAPAPACCVQFMFRKGAPLKRTAKNACPASISSHEDVFHMQI